MSSSVTVRDMGWRQIKSQCRALQGRAVRVGFRAGGSTGEVIQYASYNEFGTRREDGSPGIPARPFMRRTADEGREQIGAFCVYLAKRITGRSATVDQALDLLGQWYTDRIQQSIQTAAQWAAPLSAATVARKKSSRPLIDTRTMLRSVDYDKE